MKLFYKPSICFVFTLIALVLFTKSYSQGQYPTPNAASIGIFAQYPQSSFTGVPSISIPVCDLSYQGLQLPVQLNYNNNLVKPAQAGSWVGLGWNLSAGGAITRVVNGKPDDLPWYETDFPDWHETHDMAMGYYYNHGALSNNFTDSVHMYHAVDDLQDYGALYDVMGNTYPYLPADSRTIKDYSPDEFSFSVGDLSGVFYLDDQGNWKVRCKNKVKVIVGSNDFVSVPTPAIPASGGIPAWVYPDRTYLNRITLIDNRGITYVFGGDPNSVEEVETNFIKTWNLTKIILPSGKAITYTYQSGQYVTTLVPDHFEGNGGGYYVPTYYYLYKRPQTNHSSYLTHISSDLYDLFFYRSENPHQYARLDSMQLYSGSKLVKNFAFNYVNTSVLKLSSMVQKEGNTSSGAQYTFQYNSQNFDTTKTNTDHWGYYNTKTLQSQDQSHFYACRHADTANCRAELLEKIIYPTGGYAKYTWEPNSYSKAVNQNNRLSLVSYDTACYAGGVRIKQITNFDKDNTNTGYKKYVYIKDYAPGAANNVSSGVLYSTIAYAFSYWIPFSPYPVAALTEDNVGSHISYTEVSEINVDNSYSKTIYSNFDNGSLDEAAVRNVYTSGAVGWIPTIHFNSNAHERGLPVLEAEFLNTGALLSEKISTYIAVNKANEYVRSYTGSNYLSMPIPIIGSYVGWACSALKKYTDTPLPSQVTEYIYNTPGSGTPITRISNYTYDPVTLNLLTQTTTDSRERTIEVDNVYPTNMVATGRDPSGVYAQMVFNNNISPLIESVTKVDGTQTVLTRTEYRTLTSTMSRPDLTLVKYGTNNSKTTAKYDSYDTYGNLTTILKNNLIPTATLYGYNSNLPVAEIVNASQSEVFMENFETSGSVGLAHTGTGLYNYATYYVPFNIPDSRSYIVSYWYRVTGNIWKYTTEPYSGPRNISMSTAEAVDDVLVYPIDAQVTTYTYLPLIGISSKTDTKGYTTFYEYDGLQRLFRVRDNEGNIVKQYCYNYAGQTTGCPISPITSSSPTPPPPPTSNTIYWPAQVYIRLEATNITYDIGGDATSAHDYESGDLYVRLYSDAACTIPLTLDNDLPVTLGEADTYDDDIGGPGSEGYTYSFAFPQHTNSYKIGAFDFHLYSSYIDEYTIPHYSMFDYSYFLPAGSVYTVEPMVVN